MSKSDWDDGPTNDWGIPKHRQDREIPFEGPDGNTYGFNQDFMKDYTQAKTQSSEMFGHFEKFMNELEKKPIEEQLRVALAMVTFVPDMKEIGKHEPKSIEEDLTYGFTMSIVKTLMNHEGTIPAHIVLDKTLGHIKLTYLTNKDPIAIWVDSTGFRLSADDELIYDIAVQVTPVEAVQGIQRAMR